MAHTRRTLLKTALATAATAATASVAKTPLPAQTPPPAATPTPAPPAEPSGLARLARERYAKFLAPDELKLLDEDMAGIERRSARLRGYRLANGEEPAVDFAAKRS